MSNPQNESSSATAKAVGITGGGGVGTMLVSFAELIPDESYKRAAQSMIPIISIMLTTVFTFAWELLRIDPAEFKVRKKLTKMKKLLIKTINDPLASNATKEKANERYQVILSIEAGILPLSALERSPAPASGMNAASE